MFLADRLLSKFRIQHVFHEFQGKSQKFNIFPRIASTRQKRNTGALFAEKAKKIFELFLAYLESGGPIRCQHSVREQALGLLDHLENSHADVPGQESIPHFRQAPLRR